MKVIILQKKFTAISLKIKNGTLRVTGGNSKDKSAGSGIYATSLDIYGDLIATGGDDAIRTSPSLVGAGLYAKEYVTVNNCGSNLGAVVYPPKYCDTYPAHSKDSFRVRCTPESEVIVELAEVYHRIHKRILALKMEQKRY